MVFESVVVDILNKFLGDYVENLDRSQLKIGIWGGDASLKNLTLKSSALDELDLPVKIIYGHLGKLVLKIPWKNIYTAPVEVSVEDLFLLVNPIQDVAYDAEKEERIKQEAKQALIEKVELAKKTEREQGNLKVDDTFVEKLAAQIVKNVQIFIQNIHIRYEDRITNPERPFCVGISLHTLKVYTTNESCDRYILPQETSPIFYKIMVMVGLSVYWNTNPKLFTSNDMNEDNLLTLFVAGIAQKDYIAEDYRHILGPINSEAKLQINSKPEQINFATPKMFLSLVLEQLLVHLNRSQYQDFVALLETFDRMSKAAAYRKYRPRLHEYRGHCKEWWKFAINCVLEEDVKRRLRNWDWNFINEHRKLLKRYQIVYKAKLIEKPSESNKNEFNALERKLDAFSIILLRQKVENEIEREGRLIAERRAKKGGWFSGWFSYGNSGEEANEETDSSNLVSKLENAMTDEEKDKLYRAIDYHENAAPALYPKSFIAIRLELILRVLSVIITDDYSTVQTENEVTHPTVLCITFKEVFVSLHQRPAAQSFAISVKIRSFDTHGLCQNGLVPRIVKSQSKTVKKEYKDVFLSVYFETNPENENYDQMLHVTLLPLKIVYDAKTVARILEIFTPENDISTVKNQIQAAANTKLEEMKEKSAMRLQYAIEKSTKLDLKIDLMAPYLILPYGGFFTKNEMCLVLNLGRITVESVNKDSASLNIRRMLSGGQSEEQVLDTLMLQCYDHFSVGLRDIQILALRAGENWNPTIEKTGNVDMNFDEHILQPTSIYIDIHKCLIDDDPRLPKIKIVGNLPDVTVRITENKLLDVVSLLLSLPLWQTVTSNESVEQEIKDEYGSSIYDSALALRQKLESVNKMQWTTFRKKRPKREDEYVEDETSIVDFINVEANFSLKALTVYVTSENLNSPLIDASITGLELEFIQRTFSSEINSKLGMISLTQNYKDTIVPAINTPIANAGNEQYLISCRLIIAEKNSPLFETKYDSTAIKLEVHFTKLYVVAHLEAILDTIQWANLLQKRVIQLLTQHGQMPAHTKTDTARRRKNSSSSNASTFNTRRKKLKTKSALASIIEDQLSDASETKKKKSKSEITELKVVARLDVIQMCLQTASRPLATMDFDGFDASIYLKKSITNVDAVLQSVSICDLNPDTIYNRVAYIVEGNDALCVKISLFNTENETNDFDVVVEARMSCVRCTFINEFVMDVLKFIDNFQTSKQMIVEASAAAVASATMNVQQVYQSSTKVSLNIFADAPVIIVPRNNRNEEIFIVDFGNLSIKNSLKRLTANRAKHTPIIDEIHFNLSDMKVVRTNFQQTMVECVLLQPVNYVLVIKRNLSASWYDEVPDFDIDGVFCPIYANVTDEDFKLIMRTLDENIGSTSSQNFSNITPAATSTETESRVKEDVVEVVCHDEIKIETDDETETAIEKKIRIFTRFAMAIESVVIDLCTTYNNETDGLAKFTLSFLCVKGSILSNNDMSVHAFLSDCCLDDTRSSKQNNEVKRYMHRKIDDEISYGNLSSKLSVEFAAASTSTSIAEQTAKENNNSMIDVTYKKEALRTTIDARVSSFILIFNINHLLQLQEFITSATGSVADKEAASRKSTTASAVHNIDTQKNQLIEYENKLSLINCSITIEKPDIILVEHLDDIDTNAIILNNEADVNIKISEDGVMAVNGYLRNVQLYSCCYNPTKRAQTTSLILHPLTITLVGSTVAADNSLHLNVNGTDLQLTVTAGTIELLTKISSTIASSSEDECNSSEAILKDYTNIWYQNAVRDDYWFLKTEEGVDIVNELSAGGDNLRIINETEAKRKDIIVMSLPVIRVTLETGASKKAMPLLALRSSFQGTANRTTNELTLESFVTLEIAYYNNRLALWEPIIEPILCTSPNAAVAAKYVPWQLQANVRIVNKDPQSFELLERTLMSDGTVDNMSLLSVENETTPPALSLRITSEQRMELTLTKTCTDVIRSLTQSFNNAVSLKSFSSTTVLNEAGFACYKLVNEFGVDVVLLLPPEQPFRVAKADPNESFCEGSCESVTVKTGETVNLLMRKADEEADQSDKKFEKCLLNELNVVTDKRKFFLNVNVPCKNKSLRLPVSRADKRYFSLKTGGQSGTNGGESCSSDAWGLVSEVDIVDGCVTTILRSIVRVYNHFSVNIRVYYCATMGNKNELCDIGVVGSAQHLNLPAQAVYAGKSRLFFAPDGFVTSNEAFVWRDLQKTISHSQQMQCLSKNAENEDPFFLRALGGMEQVYFENTSLYTMVSAAYNIHLRPTLVLKNFLPIDVVCCLQGVGSERILKPGENINVTSAEPNHSTIVLRLDNYLDRTWSCKTIIKSDTPVFSVWTFISYDSAVPFTLNLGVWYSNSNDSMIFAVYCPFWMINKCGVDLSYYGVEDDGMVIHQPKGFGEPILFSFKEKSFFSKKKARVRVKDGEWSDKFSIDAAHTSGSVSCEYQGKTFQLGVNIKMNSNSLTKQVIFSPFYTIANNCPFDIEYRENQLENSDWIKINCKSCDPFWPRASDEKQKTIELRICGTNEITTSFSYLSIRTHSLMLLNKFGGLYVDIQVNEGGIYVAVSPFQPKTATALIINDTNSKIRFVEIDQTSHGNKDSSTILVRRTSLAQTCYRKWHLDALKEILFNWSSAYTVKPALIANEDSDPIDLRKDGFGEFPADDDDDSKNYWISFLDGMQRILLLTSDIFIIKRIEAVGDFAAIQKEINISLEGLGLSLVNNIYKQELLYVSISSSGVVWEKQEKSGKRFKPLKSTTCERIEQAYQNYVNMQTISDHQLLNIDQEIDTEDAKIIVNFSKGILIRPINAKLRRTYNSGVWLQMKCSEHYRQIHSKVYRLQMDNQFYDCVFPVIFFPVPPPRSVAVDDDVTAGRPFTELSIVQRINESSTVNQFIYFKVLIQEFHVKADIGFINGLVKFFEVDSCTDEEERAQFMVDYESSKEALCLHVSSVTSQDFFDLLHFSPLKIHISFSLCGENPNDGTPQQDLPIVNFLTQSVGVTLTDVNDVVFRLAYFERKHTFYSLPQLVTEVKNHYIGQFINQLYVLVFGLDVLGNPFGLVTGLKQGVEDFFYEPIQGFIQGPSEFAEGVLLGVRSLFGHTVGGAAGAVGRITGAMGKGIAALTLDEDYQKKRRQRLAHQNTSIKESGRGLVMGVVEGVGGVFIKPISGAREEGVEGLAKGVGKGMVGLIMRPASGVVDFANSAVDVARRVATCSEEVRRYRLPRLMKESGLVTPYSKDDAYGYKLLQDTEKGKYVNTDSYVIHLFITGRAENVKEILLLTNNRILYLMKSNDIFSGRIRVEWQYTWCDIQTDGIGEKGDGVFIVAENDGRRRSVIKSFKSMFHAPDKGKLIRISNENVRKWLLVKMKELIRKSNHS